MDRYAVIGHPIAHSKSPLIHAAFARQTGQELSYEALLAPLDGFAATVQGFRQAGGLGMNVTVPFKLEAHALATEHSDRAQAAGAVNTLAFRPDGSIFGDNTDGAGGAARGVILPILGQRPARLVIANRTVAKAEERVGQFAAEAGDCDLVASSFAALDGDRFDGVINATAASLGDEAPPLPPGIYASRALAYDMMYGKGDTPFLTAARAEGAARLADGLGMLVEQAAESFLLWRGVRPATAPVLGALRAGRTP